MVKTVKSVNEATPDNILQEVVGLIGNPSVLGGVNYSVGCG